MPNSGNLQFETETGNKLSSILQYVTEGTIIFQYKNKSLGDISLTGNIRLTKKLSKTDVYTFDPISMIYGNQSTMESLQIRDNTIFSFIALYRKVRINAKYWYNLLRLPLLLFSLIPVFVGSVLAQPNSRYFETKIFILEILAIVFFQSAANLLNDYFDHKSDSDDYAVIYTKLNAGSRFLQLQLINVDQIKIYSIFSLLLGAAIGLYINLMIGGIDILVIGFIGALIILLYNLPPVKLSYRWYGDIAFAFTIFPLILIGSSFVQLQTYDNFIEIILFGVGMAAFVTAILFVGNIMSYDAEKAALKTTFTVKFGKQHTLSAIIIFLVINYFIEVIIFASKREFLQFIPIIVSVILTIFSIKSLKRNIGDVKTLERSYRMLVYAFLLNYFLLVILLFV